MSDDEQRAWLERRQRYRELMPELPEPRSVVDAAEERRLYELNRAGVDEPIIVADSFEPRDDWGPL